MSELVKAKTCEDGEGRHGQQCITPRVSEKEKWRKPMDELEGRVAPESHENRKEKQETEEGNFFIAEGKGDDGN